MVLKCQALCNKTKGLVVKAALAGQITLGVGGGGGGGRGASQSYMTVSSCLCCFWIQNKIKSEFPSSPPIPRVCLLKPFLVPWTRIEIFLYIEAVTCDLQRLITALVQKKGSWFHLKALRACTAAWQPLLFTGPIHEASICSCIILIVLASMFRGYIINLWPLLPPH